MTFAHDIIIRPIISEHSMELIENRTYTFEVRKDANKDSDCKRNRGDFRRGR